MLDAKVASVIADVFKINVEEVVDDLSPDTFDDWDSLSHLRLVSALEESFNIKFENAEIMDMTNALAVSDMVKQKTAGS